MKIDDGTAPVVVTCSPWAWLVIRAIFVAIAVALWLIGFAAGRSFGADLSGPYQQIYDEFRERVAHGLDAKLYVGVRPAPGTASHDDCWLPSGSYDMADGIYRCHSEMGRAVIVPVVASPPVPEVAVRPFYQSQSQPQRQYQPPDLAPNTTPVIIVPPAVTNRPPAPVLGSSVGTRPAATYTPAQNAGRLGSTSSSDCQT